jgi:hypothetical protein
MTSEPVNWELWPRGKLTVKNHQIMGISSLTNTSLTVSSIRESVKSTYRDSDLAGTYLHPSRANLVAAEYSRPLLGVGLLASTMEAASR